MKNIVLRPALILKRCNMANISPDACCKDPSRSNIDEESYGRDGARNGQLISASCPRLLRVLQYCSRMFGFQCFSWAFATCRPLVVRGQDLVWIHGFYCLGYIPAIYCHRSREWSLAPALVKVPHLGSRL